LSNVYQVYVNKAELNRSAEISIPNGNRSGRTDAAAHALADAFEADLVDLPDYPTATVTRSVQFVTDVVTTEDVPQL
jgi:tRNA U38,U39,U40 pseudouridine synthase TruA